MVINYSDGRTRYGARVHGTGYRLPVSQAEHTKNTPVPGTRVPGTGTRIWQETYL